MRNSEIEKMMELESQIEVMEQSFAALLDERDRLREKTHGKVHKKRSLILRTHVGNGQIENPEVGNEHQLGELFELFTVVADSSPGVHYRGRYWTLDWHDIVTMALKAIDKEVDGE